VCRDGNNDVFVLCVLKASGCMAGFYSLTSASMTDPDSVFLMTSDTRVIALHVLIVVQEVIATS
jgi:hypothetical protein